MLDRIKFCWPRSISVLAASILFGVFFLPGKGIVQEKPATHTIFMTAMEIKGSTSGDNLIAPSVNPKDLSKGYGYKAPGEYDKSDAKKWQVSSYVFSPGFVTVRQGDTIKLTAFVVNGDEHEVWVNDPSGKRVVAPAKWNRGREYQLQFVAEKIGTYQLVCSEHAPSMTAVFQVLPK